MPGNASLPGYAELHCLSNFSFQRGASFPEELVQEALRLGYRGLAITDECSMAGIVRAWSAWREADAGSNLRLLIGSEFLADDGLHLVLLACNREGYGQLCALISAARRDSPKGHYHFSLQLLVQHKLDHCLALWVPGAAQRRALRQQQTAALEAELRTLAAHFPDRFWLSVQHLLRGDDESHLQQMMALGQRLQLPLCASGMVTMHQRQRRALRDVLTAVRLGRPLSELGAELPANAEQYLRPRAQLAQLFPAALLQETLHIAERCDFDPGCLRYEYPRELVPAGESAQSWLRQLAEQGMRWRWPQGVPLNVRETVARELALIAELGYEHFFLTVKDIVDFARSRDILCQGRGSAANSALCYCLGITAVDPSRMQLLFERFISRERNEPPDIDVDFEHQRREEVIQYIYRKYGRERAALAATVICYRRRSAIRDVGRALGLAQADIDRLLQVLQRNAQGALVLDGAPPPLPAQQLRQLVYLVSALIGFPRHLSQHVGGFVISEGPLSALVPIENAAMPERRVIQWEKDDLEALGLLKVDVLSLGMLTAIRRALALIAPWRGAPLTLAEVPAEDAAVYDMICQADTVGVFQIESRAQMSMLPRLRPRCYYDLVVQIAIVRPGPIQGDMVHPYLARRAGKQPVSYPSEAVAQVLSRTLGVPIFQEQVMQVAMVAAGFSGGEADQLRRAMAAWKRKGGLEPFRQRLIDGMCERGYRREFAEQIYRQIRGFADYGFPESHAASFALLAYVSAWLKCHYPAAFACALLNSQPMGFYAPSQLVQDARRHGVVVLPVDVNQSALQCSLEAVPGDTAPALRLGFCMVKGLSTRAMQRLVEARGEGPYHSVAEVVRRARLQLDERDSLAAADALRGLAGDRHRAAWQASGVAELPPLFARAPEAFTVEDDSLALLLPRAGEAQQIAADYNSTGLSLRGHPLQLLRPRLQQAAVRCAAELPALATDSALRICGIVTCRQRPQTASGVTFITLEDESGCINLVVWPALYRRQRLLVDGASLLLVEGRLQRGDGDVLHVIARRLHDLSGWLAGMSLPSRDYA